MASVGEKNAAFRVIKKEVEEWAVQLLPQNVPFIGNVRQMALDKLESPAGTQYLLKLTSDALEAAEAERATEAKQSHKA